MTRPSSETNEPEPPLLNRTDDFWTCSSQSSVISNWWRSFSSFRGASLKSHIPSSAQTERFELAIKEVSPITSIEDRVFISFQNWALSIRMSIESINRGIREFCKSGSNRKRVLQLITELRPKAGTISPKILRYNHIQCILQTSEGLGIYPKRKDRISRAGKNDLLWPAKGLF